MVVRASDAGYPWARTELTGLADDLVTLLGRHLRIGIEPSGQALLDLLFAPVEHYPNAKRLLIEADSGGSNAARSRRYKKRLQDFADQSRLEITVCHYPPGTSKWNPIEHRLFSQIAATWAGKVLGTLLILLGFIRRTTTTTGLKVTATHFDRTYRKGLKVTNAEFKTIQLTRHDTCPQWNYTIRPHSRNTE